jgi:hypothetical protein
MCDSWHNKPTAANQYYNRSITNLSGEKKFMEVMANCKSLLVNFMTYFLNHKDKVDGFL